jgi:hypothetical protein
MEYVIYANERQTDQLMEIAESHFSMFRSSPFWFLVFQNKAYAELSSEDGAAICCKLNMDADDECVYIQEDEWLSLSITLPQMHHWETKFETEGVPKWVRMAYSDMHEWSEVFPLLRFWDASVRLDELAIFLKRPASEIVREIQTADANRFDIGQQILALSVNMNSTDPTDWWIDVRGFLLGTLYSRVISE